MAMQCVHASMKQPCEVSMQTSKEMDLNMIRQFSNKPKSVAKVLKHGGQHTHTHAHVKGLILKHKRATLKHT